MTVILHTHSALFMMVNLSYKKWFRTFTVKWLKNKLLFFSGFNHGDIILTFLQLCFDPLLTLTFDLRAKADKTPTCGIDQQYISICLLNVLCSECEM